MDNQDKIYKQFKDAAEKVESKKEFPAMDKVWGNIEGKLDTKALKTENNTWKKIAVAASILLVATFGYQFLKKPETEVTVPKESVVSSEIKQDANEISVDTNQAIVTAEPKNPLIKEDATEIIKQNLEAKEKVVMTENSIVSKDTISQNLILQNSRKKENEDKSSGYFVNRNFSAISVRRYDNEETELKKAEEAVVVQEKASPLVVLDGKAVKSSKNNDYLNDAEVESVAYLDNPLYIINGVEYTEKELFGPNPTSPYYPLNKQEITSTTVLQGESATNLYGEKGKKGVVIIATKNKKPIKNKS